MDEKIVKWEGEEYISHNNGAGWYVRLFSVTLVLSLLSFYLQWWTFLALVIVSALTLLILAVRPARKISYTLTDKGFTEGDKFYAFSEFKSFGILQDDVHFAIVLTPRKRLSPAVTIYFPENKGEGIVDMFGAKLPMEPVELDLLDKIVKRLRI